MYKNIGMDQRKVLIEDFKKEIGKARGYVSDTLSDMGMYLFENHKKETRAAAQDAYDSVKHLADEIHASSENKERIIEVSERLNEITDEYADIEGEIEEIERANQPIYEKLGEAAFKAYMEDPGSFTGFEDIFSPLSKQQSEIEEIDAEIRSLSQETKTKKFFEKIADRGQVAYLRGLRLLRVKGYAKLYSKLGKELADSGYLERSDDSGLLEAAKPYLENKEHLDELKRRREELKNERERLTDELKSAGVDRKPDNRIEELNKTIESTNLELRAKLKEIAEAVKKKMPEKIEADTEVRSLITRIEEAEAKIKRFEENISKIEAAIEADVTAKRIERMREGIESHRKRIEEHTAAIEELEKQVGEAEKEKARLEKERGPEDITLLS
jgi:chromosome segregation ATPase